jgi:DNA invertase Pin-like site-specific DNA recombinase
LAAGIKISQQRFMPEDSFAEFERSVVRERTRAGLEFL